MDAVSTLWAAAIAVCALLGVGFMATATRRWRHGQVVGGTFHGLAAAICLSAAAVAVLLGGSLVTYQRLTAERPAVRASFARSGDGQFNATLTYPSSVVQGYVIRGDDWQIDARVLKWRAPANVLGFDTVYRLERISGRYADVERELTQPRTVYALHPGDRVDTWSLVRAWRDYVPWVDALYGSAAYVPMADGAAYEVTVSPSGLVARPLNGEARLAVGGWQ